VVPIESHINQRLQWMPDFGHPPACAVSQGMSVVSAPLHIRRTIPDVDFAFVAAVDLKLLSASAADIRSRHRLCARAPVRKHGRGAVASTKAAGAAPFHSLPLVVVPRTTTNMPMRGGIHRPSEVPVNTDAPRDLVDLKAAQHVAHEVAHMCGCEPMRKAR